MIGVLLLNRNCNYKLLYIQYLNKKHGDFFSGLEHHCTWVHFYHLCLGESVTKQPLIRAMRGVKKETLNLINCWVSKSSDPKLVRNFIVCFPNSLLDVIF